MIHEMCRLLGFDKTQTCPYKLQANGSTGRQKTKMAKVVLKYCAENPRTWDTTLPYLTFVYNTTINRITGATQFSMVHKQECQYTVDLFYAKLHNEVMMKDGFGDWLDKQF